MNKVIKHHYRLALATLDLKTKFKWTLDPLAPALWREERMVTPYKHTEQAAWTGEIPGAQKHNTKGL